jgi:hypothetical protein
MTGDPPSAAPSFQISPTYSEAVIDGIFARSVGASGVVRIIAPLPSSEIKELPTTLIATTLAYILEPHG